MLRRIHHPDDVAHGHPVPELGREGVDPKGWLRPGDGLAVDDGGGLPVEACDGGDGLPTVGQNHPLIVFDDEIESHERISGQRPAAELKHGQLPVSGTESGQLVLVYPER